MTTSRKERMLGDILAAGCGAVFFAVTVGVEKLDPRNVGWLTFGDQLTHWLGWRFFAEDSWRWPLGANPNYGWERMNSIVFTDSFPGLAVLFKALDLGIFNSGQYFGIGLLLGAVALFVGARRLFSYLGIDLWTSLLAAALLGTTPLFWWMQRWYPALSSGVPLLVWAFYFYLNDSVSARRLLLRWSGLMVVAVAVQAYLVIAVFAFFVAALIQRFLRDKSEIRALVTIFAVAASVCLGVMYLLGYYTVPSKWAQTGGYGWYSANLLGLIDQKGASAIFPHVPSISGQHEPTSLSTGMIVLMALLITNRIVSRRRLKVWDAIRSQFPLVVILLALFFLALTNTISVGSWSMKIPLPERIEHVLSVFRSSARFLWPLIIVLSVAIATLFALRCRFAKVILGLVLVVQIADYGQELGHVREKPNGRSIGIEFEKEFWSKVPSSYTSIAAHPAESLGTGWTECAYAALVTHRRGQCGYFSRVQGLDGVNQAQSSALLGGRLDEKTVYWVSMDWLRDNYSGMSLAQEARRDDARVVANLESLSGNSVLIIAGDCSEPAVCPFLVDISQPLREFIHGLR